MVNAMDAVKKESSIKKSAEEHAVPISTLNDQITGRVWHGEKQGHYHI